MRKLAQIKFCLIMAALLAANACAGENHDQARQHMIDEISKMVADTAAYTGITALSDGVMTAMATVPRHEFVPQPMRRFAYRNNPLPIGAGQTISQPYIVALMTHLAGISGDSRVLEVGTGSGYQAAVLATLAAEVYSIEIIETLGRNADSTLQRLGYGNVHVRIGDGYHGWPEQAPFDAILVTAAPETVPEPLLQQLNTGGRLVIPVGRQHQAQTLTVLVKQADGSVQTADVLPVGFVPLTREQQH